MRASSSRSCVKDSNGVKRGVVAMWCGLGLAPYGTRVLRLCDRGRADRDGMWKGLVAMGIGSNHLQVLVTSYNMDTSISQPFH